MLCYDICLIVRKFRCVSCERSANADGGHVSWQRTLRSVAATDQRRRSQVIIHLLLISRCVFAARVWSDRSRNVRAVMLHQQRANDAIYTLSSTARPQTGSPPAPAEGFTVDRAPARVDRLRPGYVTASDVFLAWFNE